MNQKDYKDHVMHVEKLPVLNIEYDYKEEYACAESENDKIQKLLEKNDFLKTHPFYLPFIGKEFFNQEKKILLVAESHDLHPQSKFYLKFDSVSADKKENWLTKNWYETDFSWETLDSYPQDREIPLTQTDIYWMWTESTVVDNLLKKRTGTHTMFSRVLAPVKNHSKYKNDSFDIKYTLSDDDLKEEIKKIAFMNYFLRPAEETGNSIEPLNIDKDKAYKNLIDICETLDHPYVLFISKMAYDTFKEKLPKESDFLKGKFQATWDCVSHPTSPWWFRRNKSGEKNKGFDKAVEIMSRWFSKE